MPLNLLQTYLAKLKKLRNTDLFYKDLATAFVQLPKEFRVSFFCELILNSEAGFFKKQTFEKLYSLFGFTSAALLESAIIEAITPTMYRLKFNLPLNQEDIFLLPRLLPLDAERETVHFDIVCHNSHEIFNILIGHPSFNSFAYLRGANTYISEIDKSSLSEAEKTYRKEKIFALQQADTRQQSNACVSIHLNGFHIKSLDKLSLFKALEVLPETMLPIKITKTEGGKFLDVTKEFGADVCRFSKLLLWLRAEGFDAIANALGSNKRILQSNYFTRIVNHVEDFCAALIASPPLKDKEPFLAGSDLVQQLTICDQGVDAALESFETLLFVDPIQTLLRATLTQVKQAFYRKYKPPISLEVHLDAFRLLSAMGMPVDPSLYHDDPARLLVADVYLKALASEALAIFRDALSHKIL